MGILLQEQEVVTDINKSPLILILTWFFLAVCILATVARTGTKLNMIGKLKLDDYTAMVATILAVAQSVAVLVLGTAGFGKHIEVLSQAQVSTISRSEYVATLFFILSLAIAKISVLVIATTLTPRSQHPFIFCVEGVVGLWALSAIFTVSFQCQLPRPWDYIGHSCINRSVFWNYFSASNIVTDAIIIAIIFQAGLRIQTSWNKKAVVIGVFGSRFLVIPAIACQIYFDNRFLDSPDPTFDHWRSRVVTQLIQVLSIVTTCMPVLKPFLDSLESGQIRSDDLRRQGRSAYGYNSGGYLSNTNTNTTPNSNSRRISNAVMNSFTSRSSKMHELAELPSSRKSSTLFTMATKQPAAGVPWDGQSHTSQTVLIKQTVWGVSAETKTVASSATDAPA